MTNRAERRMAETTANAILTRAEASTFLRVSLKVLDGLPIARLKLGHRTVRYRNQDLLDYVERSAQ